MSFQQAAGQLFIDKFAPELSLDHNLPAKLTLIPIEIEVFYLLHFGFYLNSIEPIYPHIVYKCEDIAVQLILHNKTRQKIGEEMKEYICQYFLDNRNISCPSLKNIEWCIANESISPHQEWCQRCINLSDCLGYDEEMFFHSIVKIFYTWRKFFTKRNILVSLMSQFLYVPYYNSFNEMGYHLKKVKPFQNSSLTLLDAWAYANGDVIDTFGPFKEFVDNSPIEALKSCAENQNANSCLSVERFSKEIGKNNTKIWEMFTENNYNDLIPLCSYASDKLILKECNLFKKMSNRQCFTSNESSFDHRVGLTQGVNFVINYDYPEREGENNPATIILHDPNQQPDIKNMMAKNFRVEPGHIIDLKFSATVIESTEDFDAMNFESRLCNEHDGKVNCLMHQLSELAKYVCGCQPWYKFEVGGQQCDALATLCYEKAILNGTIDMDLKEQCHESCKIVKYSLTLQENSKIDTEWNADGWIYGWSYGKDFDNYFLKSERLFHYLHTPNPSSFSYQRLQRSSLIHINFEESEVRTVTKDAKITLPDMVGNIGGTLGVFIGVSFLGLLDTFIEWMQYLQEKIKSLRRPKSSLPL